jgi:hypothetical protein
MVLEPGGRRSSTGGGIKSEKNRLRSRKYGVFLDRAILNCAIGLGLRHRDESGSRESVEMTAVLECRA